MANSFGTVNDNARWRERVRKEAEILARAKPTEFRLNVNTVSAYPTPPQHLNPSLNTSQVSFDVFAKYDLNGDGVVDAEVILLVQYGMVWYVMVWYGMVWHGMVWYGMVWYSIV